MDLTANIFSHCSTTNRFSKKTMGYCQAIKVQYIEIVFPLVK